ncbi:hypothetical protein PRJ_Fausto_00049 [Faustovirus]|nr:hypothetical protein PRJ_Fausto_00049 [Faustovirus]AMN83974.1 hypothetical protein D5a_00053 [Faustovirus]AMN84957.1 hypothetical protein E23_00053 [Faustovirus]QBR98962.1 hypothetical protein [Faustovirus mariensis]
MDQILPNEILAQICGYERMVFRYVNKFLHNEYLINDKAIYKKIIIKDTDYSFRLDIMTTWYEFAEYKNVKLKRYIAKTMLRNYRDDLNSIYNYAVGLKWQRFYNRIRGFWWPDITKVDSRGWIRIG